MLLIFKIIVRTVKSERQNSQFTTDYNDDASVTSDDGKERLVITGPDFPRRIDCGPKSANVSRYHRDYYVPSNGPEGNDVIYYEPSKRVSNEYVRSNR